MENKYITLAGKNERINFDKVLLAWGTEKTSSHTHEFTTKSSKPNKLSFWEVPWKLTKSLLALETT